MKNNTLQNGGKSFFRKFNNFRKYLFGRFKSLNGKQVSYFAFLIIVLSNIPFIILTINTGFFSDDYQFLNLFHLKQSISPLGTSILDIIEPKTDFHLTPFWYFFNVIVHTINESPKFYHLVVCLINIGTSLIIYFIVMKIYRSNKTALLSAILFSLSYALCHKALTWNTFSSTAINTFTGAFSFFMLIKFIENKKYIYLITSFIFLTLTILNLESGFTFFVILGIYALFNFKKKYISMNILLQTFTIIVLAFSVYAGIMMYFTGHPIPLFFARSNVGTNQELTEKIIGMRKNLIEENAATDNQSLNLSEMRSTYAPRTLSVLALRSIDLTMKIFNLSIIEDVAKSRFYDTLSIEEKISFKQKIKPVMKIGFIAAGIALVFVIPLLIFIGYHTLNRESYPFLLILICLYPVFIILFNRVDIANSLAIFSSIIMADLFISSRNKRRLFRYFGSGLMIIFVGLASLAIFDGFENTYFYNKSYRMKLSSIYDQINDQLRGYSDNAVVFVNEGSTLVHPVMNYENPTNWLDMSHYNAFIYKDEFMKTRLAKEYRDKSFNEFVSAKDLRDNIQWILVKNADNSNIRYFNDKYNKVIYVDEIDNVIKIL